MGRTYYCVHCLVIQFGFSVKLLGLKVEFDTEMAGAMTTRASRCKSNTAT